MSAARDDDDGKTTMVNPMLWVGWPAFLAACALELLVFAMVDPLDLQWSGHALGLPRQAVYTLAFFAFWAICLAACALTALLRTPPAEVNRSPS